MDTKRDIENKARSLIESSPEESVVLYEKYGMNTMKHSMIGTLSII